MVLALLVEADSFAWQLLTAQATIAPSAVELIWVRGKTPMSALPPTVDGIAALAAELCRLIGAGAELYQRLSAQEILLQASAIASRNASMAEF